MKTIPPLDHQIDMEIKINKLFELSATALLAQIHTVAVVDVAHAYIQRIREINPQNKVSIK